MAQLLVELCTILIEEGLGERIASLWQHMADVGRSSFKELLTSSSVPKEELGKLLAILMQHRCISYFTDEEYDCAYYTIDIEGAYNLLRLSRLVAIARKRCGADAASVMANVAQFGHVSVADLTSAYELDMDDLNYNNVNGVHANGDGPNAIKRSQPDVPIKSIHQLHTAILALLRAGFLIRAKPHFSQNAYDLEQELEQKIVDQDFAGKRVTGPVSSKAFRDTVNAQKKRQRDMDFASDEFMAQDADRSGSALKRRKLDLPNGHHTAGGKDANAGSLLNDDLVLFINIKKYLIALRSEHLAERATHALAATAGSVYHTLLRTLERQMHDIKQEVTTTLNYDSDDDDDGAMPQLSTSTTQPKTTAIELSSILPPDLDFTTSIKIPSKDLPNRNINGHKSSKLVVVEEDDFSGIGIKPEPVSDGDDEEDGDLRNLADRAKLYELLNNHLELLAEHPFKFCTKVSNRNPPEWQVDFPVLAEKLILAEIDATISARFGTAATRLVRLLRDKGKLEEKQISTMAYMHMKDVRALLTELFANGFVDAQELAKDNTRQPSKALYLWCFDVKKVRAAMLQQCYQAICRAYQRMAFERERYATVLQKVDDTVRDKLLERRTASEDGAPSSDITINGAEQVEGAGRRQDCSKYVLTVKGLTKDFTASTHTLEKQQYQEWRQLEALFLAHILRLDDLVVLLRDI